MICCSFWAMHRMTYSNATHKRIVPSHRGHIVPHHTVIRKCIVPYHHTSVPYHRTSVPYHRTMVPYHRTVPYRTIAPAYRTIVPYHRTSVPNHRTYQTFRCITKWLLHLLWKKLIYIYTNNKNINTSPKIFIDNKCRRLFIYLSLCYVTDHWYL